MEDREPEPFGIPNSIGNTCWFQSATQCIFRNPEFRKKILSFDPSKLQIKSDQSTLDCLMNLHDHFSKLSNPKSGEIDNSKVVTTMKYNGEILVTPQTSSGKDSYIALNAYYELFATLLGDSRFNFHTFKSPLSSLQMIQFQSSSSTKMLHIIYLILRGPGDNKKSVLEHFDKIFYLPEVLVLRQDSSNPDRIFPDPTLTLPEPIDYVVSGKDLSKCHTEIKYELYGMICYQGNNADHAFALIKVYGTNQWYEFNDQKVDKKGGDEVLKNEQLLSAKFNWPALFFYRKLK